MEHIVRERIYPQAASHIPRLRLSPFMLIVFSMLVGFAAVIIGVRAVARYTPAQSMPNPFPAYADVFPGQPLSAVETRAFLCSKDYDYYLYTEIKCTLTPPEGVFSRIEVLVYKGIILQISFIMRDNRLTVGDVEALLEMPTTHRFNRTAYFVLPTSLVRADTFGHGEPFSLFRPVWGISFMKLS